MSESLQPSSQPSSQAVRYEEVIPWRDVASGINSGSWAVLLVAFVIFISFRKNLTSYLDKQVELMDVLKDTLKAVTTTQEGISKNLEDQHEENIKKYDIILQHLRAIYAKVNK